MDILKELVSRNNWFVLTGAGVSLDSGIPTYRDSEGNWTRAIPVESQDFIRSSDVEDDSGLETWLVGVLCPKPSRTKIIYILRIYKEKEVFPALRLKM